MKFMYPSPMLWDSSDEWSVTFDSLEDFVNYEWRNDDVETRDTHILELYTALLEAIALGNDEIVYDCGDMVYNIYFYDE